MFAPRSHVRAISQSRPCRPPCISEVRAQRMVARPNYASLERHSHARRFTTSPLLHHHYYAMSQYLEQKIKTVAQSEQQDPSWREREIERLLYDLEYERSKGAFRKARAEQRMTRLSSSQLADRRHQLRIVSHVQKMDSHAKELMVLKVKSALPTVFAPWLDVSLVRRVARTFSTVMAIALLGVSRPLARTLIVITSSQK